VAFEFDSRRIGIALLAAASSAVLIWFGTGLHPAWPLLWLAPLPVLVVAARSPWWAAGLTAALAWALGNLNMAHYYATLLHIPLAVSAEIIVAPALVFAFAVLLYRALLRRGAAWSAVVAFPAAWVSFEYVLNLTSPHATLGSLAYSQLTCLPVLQLASITGPWGISFLVLMVPAALAIWIDLRSRSPKQGFRILLTTLCVLALVAGFGALRLASPPPPGQVVKVGLVASDAGANAGVAAPGAATDALLRDYAAQTEALAARGAQMIVLPEHVGEIVDPQTANVDALFQALADRTRVTVVVGVSHVTAGAAFNQARVYAPDVAEQSYDKHHMLPPFESMFTPGKTILLLDEPRGKWGVEICKDMDFTALSRAYGNAGAGLVLAPAWDFQLDWISHGHVAIMRGVEDGFGIARAGRGGSLLVTDNRGRILAETRSNSAPFATLIADVPAIHDITLYLLWGDWFAWFALGALAFTLARLVSLPRLKPE
jgi:apolipoprotein N-acyltransferase